VRRLVAILALGGLLLAVSASAAPNPANQASLDKTVRYLQEAQQENGGFGAVGEPSQITSAWTAIALAAAGINPRNQRRPGGVDAFSYLVSHYRQGVDETECAPIACTTTFERELMVVNASGTNPHDFGGVDLAAELLSRAGPDGAFPHVPGGQPGVNDTIFAIFALAPIEEPGPQAAIGPAADWIESIQLPGGGWAWNAAGARDEVDMTGAAIQALIAAGRGRNEAVEEGIDYLRGAQNADGGFPEFPGNPESNVASTAWGAQGVWAVGENPEDWHAGSGADAKDPLGYMESMQQPDGHIRWKLSQDLNGIWMTAYCSVALGGHVWPIPEAPLSNDPVHPPKAGQGEGTQSGAGVIAGGGGRGAPLFSRPKPQSKGKTPGGKRVTHDQSGKARDHSRTRRGENAHQPTGTAGSEPTGEEEATAAGAGTDSTGSGGGTSAGGSAAPLSPGDAPGAGSQSGGSAAGELAASAGEAAGDRGREVTGTVVGESAAPPRKGPLAFGAPGLHSAGVDSGGASWPAIAIVAAAALLALVGSQLDRRRGGAYA
jgi:Squalene-hopene cyclase C-terminal domain/Prenyltransferase and squalene oxidase repeat